MHKKEHLCGRCYKTDIVNNITGIPNNEDDMTLIGILSEQDVLRLFHTYDNKKDRTENDFMTQPAIQFEQNEFTGYFLLLERQLNQESPCYIKR